MFDGYLEVSLLLDTVANKGLFPTFPLREMPMSMPIQKQKIPNTKQIQWNML